MTDGPSRGRSLVATAAFVGVALCGCAAGSSEQRFDDALIHNRDQPLHYGVDSRPPPDGTDWSGFTSWWTDDQPATSFGFHLCVDRGAEAVITAVEPLTTVGDVEVLPAMLMTMNGANDFFISRAGYPPEVSDGDELSPLDAAPVTAECGNVTPGQGLVLALRAVDETGGGWRGFGIDYMVNGAPYRLEIPAELYMCGTSTEPCWE